ncbi:hypothetical protein OM076_30515 [Solirubrobacter ginsenosidimutans]|uniref:Uncharacterized protein n=1 Tax=Solirubrobacter ginsenosidimutans TaxID=490573 RepID=A0A9X3S2I4_9ACTN|nr:hypothetical protein [Solirubrobacter ginsenosidimutans]MDA0164640.1 hypothetical protein [Solirubrobacter ginsenosidimutans]
MTDAGDGPRSDPDAPTAKLPRVPSGAGEAPTAELPRVPPKAPAPRRERIRKPGPLTVIAGSFGLFFAITALLAAQMRRGADPALGAPKPQLLAAAPAPRHILVRRVIVTRIVESAQGGAPSNSRPPSVSPGTPAPPAAPAPAPAPLTTRSS